MAKIELNMRQGEKPRVVDATIVDSLFAVHKALSGSGWAITHVPTRTSILGGFSIRLKKEALLVAKMLVVDPITRMANWNSEDPLFKLTIYQKDTLRRRIIELCAHAEDSSRAQRLQDRIDEVKKLQTVKFK